MMDGLPRCVFHQILNNSTKFSSKEKFEKIIFSPHCRQPSADHHHFAQKMPPEDIIHSGDIFISKKGVLLSPPEFWNTGHPGLRVFQEAPWALPQWQEPPICLSKSSLSCHWHPRTPLLTPFSRKSLDVYSPLPLNWESPSAKEKVVINHHPSQGLGKFNTLQLLRKNRVLTSSEIWNLE